MVLSDGANLSQGQRPVSYTHLDVYKRQLPYLLAFAAGAMIYVVIKELVPESMENEGYRWGLWGFTVGFLIMMILDVVFG